MELENILNEITAEVGENGTKIYHQGIKGSLKNSPNTKVMGSIEKNLEDIKGTSSHDAIVKAMEYAKKNGFYNKISKFNTVTPDIDLQMGNVIFRFDDGGQEVVPLSKVMNSQKQESKIEAFKRKIGL